MAQGDPTKDKGWQTAQVTDLPRTGDAPDPQRRGIARWIWRDYLGKHKVLLIIASALMLVEGVTFGALSRLIEPMFDRIFVQGDTSAISLVAFGIAGVFIVRATSAFGHRVLTTLVGQRVLRQMQNDLVRHMLTLDRSFFSVHSPGTLIERVRGDSQAVAALWNVVLSSLIRDLVAIIALLAVAFSVDWRWTLIAIAGAPLLSLPVSWLQKRVRGTTRSSRATAARIATRLDEMFHGISSIKLAGTEAREAERTHEETGHFATTQVRSQAAQAGIVALIDIMAAIGFLGVLLYGSQQIIGGEKTVGEFMSFFTALALIFDPMRRLGNVSGAWQAALASLERLRMTFDATPSIVSPKTPVAPPAAPREADIVFEDVTFSYGDTHVLRGLSFVAEAGKTTALVGPSGAGKTTVFHLLTRLEDRTGGTITVGGIDVTAMTIANLRGLYSSVSQEALLFDESLRANILMGEEKVDEAQLATALEASHVTDFLDRLPEGLETEVGPRGSNLSGGQRQRVAIARAIVRDAPILLLDEATSALDAQSEKVVQEALDNLAGQQTTLVIAHRLATIRNADRIVVMDRGVVVDQGTHDELLARGGLYADLYHLQFRET